MSKKIKFSLIACIAVTTATATVSNARWEPAGDKIMTVWGENLSPENVHGEYPRPIMERKEWQSLNGLWDWAVTPLGSLPGEYEGKILVPFPIESALSGVGRRVDDKHELWYTREFDIPGGWAGRNVLLHFGAVDWKTEVWVNGMKTGSHTGGYSPFHFDITPALVKGKNTVTVKVWDPTDKGYQPRGKQVANPHGIWYTPVTGIWQTVWLEPVAQTHIEALRTIPDIDRRSVMVEPVLSETRQGDVVLVEMFDEGRPVASARSLAGLQVEVVFPGDIKLWDTENPFLYDMAVSIIRGKSVVDRVESYAAMRKFSAARDADGIMRMQLNGKNIFMFGPLDQGWWPDGLYTAPSDEALVYDIAKTREAGFNMIRKHVKVEPARWYTHCDRMGIIVWQDMPNGDVSPVWKNKEYFTGTELSRTPESEENFRREWKEIIDNLYSYPSIAVWVPFNEAWGQFKTGDIADWTKSYDPSRLVNPASGGNHYPVGDILDLHNYPGPEMYLYDPLRVNVLGEYGGIGRIVKGHLWAPDHNWGYVQFDSERQVTDKYAEYADELQKLIRRGFAAAVYTQTTDVEIEINGFMTYDRKVFKFDLERFRAINRRVCESLSE